MDKNAFQYDAYRPLRWPSAGSGGICPGGGVSVQGVSAQRGVSAQGGYLPKEGCLPRGVSARGCLPDNPPNVNRITDACENITLLQLCCGR